MQFSNQAHLSYDGKTTDSNVTVGRIDAALSATMTVLTPQYLPNSEITFVISLVNTAETAFSSLTLTDDLGAYSYTAQTQDPTLYPLCYLCGSVHSYVNGIEQLPPEVSTDNGVTFSGLSVPAGGSTLVIFQARITSFAPLESGSTITNTAVVTGSSLFEPITTAVTIYAASAPSLSLLKALNPEVVMAGESITYRFEIQNSGNTAAAAADCVKLTDTFLPRLSSITVLLNGDPLAEGEGYTYNSATGAFSTVGGVITVPAATYTRSETGAVSVTPGKSILQVTGTISENTAAAEDPPPSIPVSKERKLSWY